MKISAFLTLVSLSLAWNLFAERRIFRNLRSVPVSPSYEAWTPSVVTPLEPLSRDFSVPPPGVPSNAVHLSTTSLFGSSSARYPQDPYYPGPISVSMFRTAQRFYLVHNYGDGRRSITVNPGANGN